MSTAESALYVLVMAGGRGTRFWPRSRRRRPKQCLPVIGGRSLLRRTVDRVAPLVPPERVLVVTAADMAESVAREIDGLPPESLLVEPEGRNTAPCVGWGAVEIARRSRGRGAVMAVLPADHLVDDEDDFRRVLAACAAAARSTNALVTIGLEPTRAETGFGYLRVGCELGRFGGLPFLRVDRFVEKPDRQTAARYVEGGRHLWNGGMFVFTVEAIRDALRQHLPDTWAILETLRHSPERLAELYPRMERVSLDYGVMERASHVLTIRGEFGWSDVGSWEALAERFPEGPLGRQLVEAGVAVDAGECVVHAPGRLVALVGVRDLVVVDSGDALLVCRRGQGERLREVVEALEARGLERFL